MGRSRKLGDEFWGQWYRTDNDKYTVEKFKDELESLCLQTALTVDESTISMEELRANLLKVKEHMRSKGFRPPVPSDKRVISVWSLESRSCNSATLQAYLVQLEICPESIRNNYVANVAGGKSAEKRMSGKTMDAIRAAAAEGRWTPLPERDRQPPGSGQEDLRSFSERILTPDEIAQIDERLARFCYM